MRFHFVSLPQRAIDNYSLPVIAEKYETHFNRLRQLWGEGWYAKAT